jgi:hypothetical protein
MTARGAGRGLWGSDWQPIAKGVVAILATALLTAIAGGILWGVTYRIAKAIGGW